jgi:guanidinoacetate N-methyltransferase
MTRKLKKNSQLELTLEIRDDTFIRPPREAQRNALLNSAVQEFIADLQALDTIASRFVSGSTGGSLDDRTQASLTDQQIMEDWQLPVMRAMVDAVADPGCDLLEVGFGRGVSAQMIQDRGVGSHTILECNETVMTRFEQWRASQQQDIILVPGLWQDTIPGLGQFDSIFFHTYPLNEDEYMEYVHGATTFAEHFFPVAAAHLREGGAFTYFSNEIDSLGRGHQRQLLRHFSSFTVAVVELDLPPDVVDTWWADTMAIVKAVK